MRDRYAELSKSDKLFTVNPSWVRKDTATINDSNGLVRTKQDFICGKGNWQVQFDSEHGLLTRAQISIFITKHVQRSASYQSHNELKNSTHQALQSAPS